MKLSLDLSKKKEGETIEETQEFTTKDAIKAAKVVLVLIVLDTARRVYRLEQALMK